jgi:hypothetical protein
MTAPRVASFGVLRVFFILVTVWETGIFYFQNKGGDRVESDSSGGSKHEKLDESIDVPIRMPFVHWGELL